YFELKGQGFVCFILHFWNINREIKIETLMKRFFALACLVTTSWFAVQAQDWKPAGDKILTTWGEQLDPANPHPEYPRPQLELKDNWKSLNGLWKYTVVDKSVSEKPTSWEGDILVPFAIESSLSGVGREVGKDKALWYNRT